MKKILLYLSIFTIITNCNLKQNIEHHGVHLLDKKNEKLRINEYNKNDVIRELGPPSVQSSFDEDLFFYIERKIHTQGLYKLGKREILKNNVLIIKFDNRGLLVKKEFIDLEKMNDLEITKKITDIDYQKTSFIYDFLSSMRQKVNDPLGKRSRK
tara:strand:+ start:171 stop:635 length:465 start_codon:yes stop_codon:yes gene_type:complete